MKINFWPFHKHDYKLRQWRLVHRPHYEPSRIVLVERCETCGKFREIFHKDKRNIEWEKENEHLEGIDLMFWR